MKKKFQTRTPTAVQTLEIENEDTGVITEFKLGPPLPGVVLLDYLTGADGDSPQEMAAIVNKLIDEAIAPEDLDRWHEYTRDRANNIDLSTLSDIAAYCSEVLSGNPQPESLPSGSG